MKTNVLFQFCTCEIDFSTLAGERVERREKDVRRS